jgi:2-polyprenyl-3-methyl-5-hydroxy-6-metoxy-1,4-benzoquinol methylase
MSIDLDRIHAEKADIVARYGPWTAHNIHLVGDVYTIQNGVAGDEFRLRRVMQVVNDLASGPLPNLRILDLACLEGMYAVELARVGARVLAIEGRESNLAKAAFVKRVLDLEKMQLIHDDVRNLSREQHGEFDIVLCLGILYHLGAPDVFTFLERVAEVCSGFVIIATHTSLAPIVAETYKGRSYWGAWTQEHAPDSTREERERKLWSSLDNVRSFVLTKPSLYNLLAHVGFTSVFQCRIPPETVYEYPEPKEGLDWSTVVAIAGRRAVLSSAPLMNSTPWEDLPDGPAVRSALATSRSVGAGRRYFDAVARRIRRIMHR